jgi:hypothetical protein
VLTDYTGPCTITAANTVVDKKTVNCSLSILGDNTLIKNSVVNGSILINSEQGSATLQDTTVNSTDHQEGALDGNFFTLIRVNISGGQHSFSCSFNCIVRDSYLHDQYPGLNMGWHQNGFLSWAGGHDYELTHNSIGCVDGAGCTADITFLNEGDQSDATVDRNLLLAAPSSSFCSYPAGGTESKPGLARDMKWTNNVFQRGANAKCGYYGPIYYWNSQGTNPNADGYGNVWIGNIWDDGSALNP